MKDPTSERRPFCNRKHFDFWQFKCKLWGREADHLQLQKSGGKSNAGALAGISLHKVQSRLETLGRAFLAEGRDRRQRQAACLRFSGVQAQICKWAAESTPEQQSSYFCFFCGCAQRATLIAKRTRHIEPAALSAGKSERAATRDSIVLVLQQLLEPDYRIAHDTDFSAFLKSTSLRSRPAPTSAVDNSRGLRKRQRREDLPS